MVSSASRNTEFAAAEIRLGQRFSNHVAGMNRNAESLRRLGDLHEACQWVFRCTPPGCTTPRQWGRTPRMQGDMSATRLRRAGPAANLKIQSRRRLGTAFYSSFKLLCHGVSRWPGLQRPPCPAKCHDTFTLPWPSRRKECWPQPANSFLVQVDSEVSVFPKIVTVHDTNSPFVASPTQPS